MRKSRETRWVCRILLEKWQKLFNFHEDETTIAHQGFFEGKITSLFLFRVEKGEKFKEKPDG